MNLRDKIGQRFIFALPYVTELTDEVAEFLVHCRAGGLVLFGFNIKNLEQIAQFNRDLQALAAKAGLPPFILSLDEEGGNVSRMPAEGQELITPSQMALGVAGPEAVQACAEVTARRLRRLGFNLNYAPVMDVNNNPANPVIGTRSYAADPNKVAELGSLAIKTYLKNSVSPCVKHFPGHGDTDVDSHFGLPVVDKSLEQLRQFELVPFAAAIKAGVPAIMTAHILYPQVEKSDLPATFSHTFLTDLLRNELDFNGLIITDCLDMQAIAARYDLGAGAILALRGGADLVMIKGTLADQQAAFEKVVAAAEAGQIDLDSNDQTWARLQSWRARFCLPQEPSETPASDYQIVAKYAEQGLTVTRNTDNLLPLDTVKYQKPLLLDFTLAMASPVEEGRQPEPLLERELQAYFPNLQHLAIPTEVPANSVEAVSGVAQQSDLAIIVTRNAVFYPQQAELIQTLLQSGLPAVVIAAREPYDLDLFPQAHAAIATYGDPPATVSALAKLLAGK